MMPLRQLPALMLFCVLIPARLWALQPQDEPGWLPPRESREGYLCRLLINEVAFPGELAYVSEQSSLSAMSALMLTLDARLRRVPAPYTQKQVAAVTTGDIEDIITAGGFHGQCEGFYRDNEGRLSMAKRVEQRVARLQSIARSGKPGTFSRLLRHAALTACNYRQGVVPEPDLHKTVTMIGGVEATGCAFAWMSDEEQVSPGGSFLGIPDANHGSLGGNRFFTLRRHPR